MYFDRAHQKYANKRVGFSDDLLYFSSGDRCGPYVGSFMINYVEVYFDEESYICDVEGLVGNPRRIYEDLILPPEQNGNFIFEGEADKMPPIPFGLVDSTSLYQYENSLLVGWRAEIAVRVFSNFGFFVRDGVICGAYANINKYK